MYPHRIRLRGPWECEPLARRARRPDGQVVELPAPLPPPRRLTMPGPWRNHDLADFTGRLRFRRRFGYPGQIDSYERVWLTCAGVHGSAEVSLNEHPLAHPDNRPFEHEVTALLKTRNCLDILIDALSLEEGALGEVALEVRCTAFLRNLRAQRAGTRLEIAGEVVGFADQPLELYVLGDRQTLAYAPVAAALAGAPFHIDAELEPAAAFSQLRVDLVNRSTIWCSLELPFPL